MSRRIYLLLLTVILISCESNQSPDSRQFYSQYTENDSDKKVMNVLIQESDTKKLYSSVGNLLPNAIDKIGFIYTAC